MQFAKKLIHDGPNHYLFGGNEVSSRGGGGNHGSFLYFGSFCEIAELEE